MLICVHIEKSISTPTEQAVRFRSLVCTSGGGSIWFLEGWRTSRYIDRPAAQTFTIVSTAGGGHYIRRRRRIATLKRDWDVKDRPREETGRWWPTPARPSQWPSWSAGGRPPERVNRTRSTVKPFYYRSFSGPMKQRRRGIERQFIGSQRPTYGV